jgi:hypothetical protein
MPRAGFEPATPATKLPQTYALDRAATGVLFNYHYDDDDDEPTTSMFVLYYNIYS